MYFLLATKANCPTYLWKQVHQNLKIKNTFNAYWNNKKKIIAFSYYDKKIVNFLTNIGNLENIIIKQKSKPTLITCYNKFMNGVDKTDNAHNLYLFHHKNRKWTRACFYSFLKFIIHNAIIIYNFQQQYQQQNQQKQNYQITYKETINEITEYWAKTYQKIYLQRLNKIGKNKLINFFFLNFNIFFN